MEFHLTTRTSFQQSPTHFDLQDITEVMKSYPLIERRFFDDLIELCRTKEHYYVEMGLLQLRREDKKELHADSWILIWAVDFKDRLFQILVERPPENQGKGSIAALGPVELLEFVSSMKQNAILPTLTLINTPDKMKQVGVIVSRPKSYQQKAKERTKMHAMGRFKSWINDLQSTPNKEGQWFPGDFPKCPSCEGPMVGIQDANNSAYGHMICPQCGYSEKKLIGGNPNQDITKGNVYSGKNQ